MRVAIIGMGAIGHVIQRALAGRVEVVPIDRTKAPLQSDEGPVDAAVVCVKTLGTMWAAEVAQHIVAPDGVVLTIQNGLGNYEILAAAVGEARVAVGVIYVGARLEEGDRLWATGPAKAELVLPSGAAPKRALDALVARLTEGGMTVGVVKDAWASVWRKVAVNAAMNPITALLGYTNTELLADRAASRVADGLATEVARVASATGVGLSEDDARRAWRDIATLT